MKKKLLMFFSLLMLFSIGVWADGTYTNYSYENNVYSAEAKTYVAQIGDTKYETLAAAVEAAATDATLTTIKLLADIDDEAVVIGGTKNINLDLAGHILSSTENVGSATGVRVQGTLAISDSNPTAAHKLTESTSGTTTTWTVDDTNGTIAINGGIVTGEFYLYKRANDPDGAYKLILNAGNLIAGSSAVDAIWGSGSFEMNGGLVGYASTGVNLSYTLNGGTITKCSTGAKGNGTINEGASISYNTNGVSDGSVTMNGGSISYNLLGVVNSKNNTFTMNGGEISHNGSETATSASAGGVVNQGTFNLNDGSISYNTKKKSGGSLQGAGLYMEAGTFNMAGGTISYNTSDGHGGGVSVNGGTANISGGSIVNNTMSPVESGRVGAGITVAGGTLNISGTAVIRDNTTTGDYADAVGSGNLGVYSGTLNISGGKIAGKVGYKSVDKTIAGTISGGLFDEATKNGLAALMDVTTFTKSTLAFGTGKTFADNTNADTKAAYPYGVGDKQAIQKTSDYTIDDVDNTSSTTEKTTAVETNTLTNANVTNYATDVESNVAEDAIPAEATKNYVSVKLTAATTSTTQFTSGATVVTEMKFDVKPVYVTVVEGAEQENVISNDDIKSGITFRLPVDKNVTATSAEVLHNATSIGYYPIQGDASNGKYIEISATSFSEYTYTLSDVNGTLTVYAGNSTKVENVAVSDWSTYQAATPNAIAIINSAFASWAETQTNVLVEYTVGANGNKYYECPKLVLHDPLEYVSGDDLTGCPKANFYSPVDFTALTGSYSRALDEGYNVACVPFAITSGFGSTELLAYNTYNQTENSVYFTYENNVDAGVAVVINTTAARTWNVTFSNTAIKGTPISGTSFTGVFVSTEAYAGTYYAVNHTNGKFSPLANKLFAFRSCFRLDGDTNLSQSKAAPKLVIIGKDVTGVNEIKLNKNTEKIFSINGQYVGTDKANLTRGIYVINGKKVFIK